MVDPSHDGTRDEDIVRLQEKISSQKQVGRFPQTAGFSVVYKLSPPLKYFVRSASTLGLANADLKFPWQLRPAAYRKRLLNGVSVIRHHAVEQGGSSHLGNSLDTICVSLAGLTARAHTFRAPRSRAFG